MAHGKQCATSSAYNCSHSESLPRTVARLQVKVFEGDTDTFICSAVKDEATLSVRGVVLGVAWAGKLTTQTVLAEEQAGTVGICTISQGNSVFYHCFTDRLLINNSK